jgi:hypothetical protein
MLRVAVALCLLLACCSEQRPQVSQEVTRPDPPPWLGTSSPHPYHSTSRYTNGAFTELGEVKTSLQERKTICAEACTPDFYRKARAIWNDAEKKVDLIESAAPVSDKEKALAELREMSEEARSV